jgi:hypothetical protein
MAKASRKGFMSYYIDLGRIIDMFARIEGDLQALLWHEAGVSDAVGKAVFSGVRIDQAMQFCRRIWAANGVEKPEQVERAFSQLALLNSLRNDMVHYGAKIGTGVGDYVVTNERLAHTAAALRRHALPPSTFHDINNDLIVISAAIELHCLSESADGVDFTRPQLESLARQPWQYKPPAQALPQDKTLRKRLARLLPPRSSKRKPQPQK